MTIHISRDLQNYATASGNPTYKLIMYHTSIFLNSVLGYTIVGQTSFDLEGTFKIASGNLADINQGGLNRFAVAIDPSEYVISQDDINKIFVLKSDNNPRHNSGLFRITNIDMNNNWVIVDYRSPDDPPIETGLSWAIYQDEDDITWESSDNSKSSGEYRSDGDSTSSRIIFQSPINSFQVRICHESPSSDDQTEVSYSVGVDGDSSGDFLSAQDGGEHTHAAMFHNRESTDWRNIVVGANGSSSPSRVYIWGDTEIENVTCIWRDGGSGNEGIVIFGLTKDEEPSITDNPLHRAFVIGGVDANGSRLILRFDYSNEGGIIGGNAFGYGLQPVSCILSQYCPLDMDSASYSSSTAGVSWFSSFSQDNPYLKQTELIHCEVVAGTFDGRYENSDKIWPHEYRRIGTCPMVSLGRAGFGDWSLTIDNNLGYFHTKNGIFMPWEGPRIIP